MSLIQNNYLLPKYYYNPNNQPKNNELIFDLNLIKKYSPLSVSLIN